MLRTRDQREMLVAGVITALFMIFLCIFVAVALNRMFGLKGLIPSIITTLTLFLIAIAIAHWINKGAKR